MVNNSTNINKTTIHLASFHWEKNTMIYDFRNPESGSAQVQAQSCGKVKSVNWIPTLILLTTGRPQ